MQRRVGRARRHRRVSERAGDIPYFIDENVSQLTHFIIELIGDKVRNVQWLLNLHGHEYASIVVPMQASMFDLVQVCKPRDGEGNPMI